MVLGARLSKSLRSFCGVLGLSGDVFVRELEGFWVLLVSLVRKLAIPLPEEAVSVNLLAESAKRLSEGDLQKTEEYFYVMHKALKAQN